MPVGWAKKKQSLQRYFLSLAFARLSKISLQISLLFSPLWAIRVFRGALKFLGNIDVAYLEDFLKSVVRISKHPNIDRDFFAFLRINIAFKENYIYCKEFNYKMLLTKYPQEAIDKTVDNIENIPLDNRHKQLGKMALKVIYNSLSVTSKDFEGLYKLGWSQKDVFDAIEHAGTLFRNGRILNAYMDKKWIF